MEDEKNEAAINLIRKYPIILRCILKSSNKNSVTESTTSYSEERPAKRMRLSDHDADSSNMIFQQLELCSKNDDNTWDDSPFVQDFKTGESHNIEEQLGELLSSVSDDMKKVNIDGIELSIVGESQSSNLVLLDSTVSNLNGLALGVATGKPVCLCGPVGCGKTALVQHLALITGHVRMNRFYRVQLGEEMDSKLLLGSYKCTDVPGEFIWQPGVLTKAVISGDWILFEDIDSATNDVVSLLVSLIERNSLNVPGYRDNIIPASGFQLFFTQRLINSVSGYFQSNSATTELLRKYWLPLSMESLNRGELEKLIQIKYPVLSTIARRMVEVFLLFSPGFHDKNAEGVERLPSVVNDVFGSKGRLTSTRDLLKWCARCIIDYDVSSQQSALNVVQNAIDIFCCNVSSGETRLKLAEAITSCLGVVKTKAEYFCKTHKPTIILNKSRCIAGRATLERLTPSSDVVTTAEMTSKLYFAATRPACCLMERVAFCLFSNEPVLLVGETGTGKTSTLQLLAKHTGNTLVVLNMNQQSDSTDLLGGYKPVDVKYVINMLRNEFEELFRLSFTVVQNNKFLNHISNCFNDRDWSTLIKLMKHVRDVAITKESSKAQMPVWRSFGDKLERLTLQLKHDRALAFSFIEGALIRAVRQGYWVLLDEINLASAETLQCLSGLLEENGTLCLYEKGELEPVKRHDNFRLMAAMNPATDVGKKQLPSGIRNRFTELFVDELTDRVDLITLVACYLRELASEKIDAVATFYLKVRLEAQNSLNDGTGHRPHYSLRTLCRALSIVAANPCKNILRSLYEAFCLSFLTQLDPSSRAKVETLIINLILGVKCRAVETIATAREKIKGIVKHSIPEPGPPNSHLCFQGYWLMKGSTEINVSEKYILTESVTENLKDLVRIVSMSNHPVLLQGDTSVGKTSLITYLANASGNKCLRINNHEHTDLQEYIGTYSVDDETNALVFKEGVLVEAMRYGYWIILDELNLAPSDVLEALNRVLDDNRELYIPETQTTVKADPKFRLFATQNPPGLYGGRKMLSRAFRNRFIELHFGEIPSPELEHILYKRCDMPPSYTKKIVAVMKELQMNRRASAAFAGKHGFITLRDLFRWGERYRLSSLSLGGKFYDWDQHIADEGYLVLAGRVRKEEEAEIVLKALEKHTKRKVDTDRLFNLTKDTSPVTKHILEAITRNPISGFEHIVWTYNLRRMAALVGKALEFQEPILLVGETGCGKTTICQFLAALRQQKLFVVNCHQHTESSDFLGGLRPVRQRSENEKKLFEWVDGPLVEAMKHGDLFLADEISLTNDSVLERLNSLLEPERTLLLSEKSSSDSQLGEIITASSEFFFLSTMNPGGDYGKKELSPALRNRLTEIWCESCTNRDDLVAIVEHNAKEGLSFGNQEDGTSGIGKAVLNFVEWFASQNVCKRMTWSVRDILLWVKFINKTTEENDELILATNDTYTKLSLCEAYIHGAHLVFLDGLGTGLTGNYKERRIKMIKDEATQFLRKQIELFSKKEYDRSVVDCSAHSFPDGFMGVHPFYVRKGPVESDHSKKYPMSTTTKENVLRLFRALQLSGRAVLLEGSPGVGKTSTIEVLAANLGFRLTRINLSEQTDISDLFGADLPVDGAEGGVFAWRDGPFLKALKDGHWILLDELNLASQSVLEGLNAVLDHRGELFIPELGRTFLIQSSATRLFACQNPVRQGGGRKGLPASFLNRFTKVYMESLKYEDLLYIVNELHPELSTDMSSRMINFNSVLAEECGVKWALRGAPWEMNLRDMTRWCEVMKKYDGEEARRPERFVELIYADRMRTQEDREKVLLAYANEFDVDTRNAKREISFYGNEESITFGDISMARASKAQQSKRSIVIDEGNTNLILRHQLKTLRSLSVCLEMNWFVILVGSSGSGKTKIVQTMAQLCNEELDVLSVNSAMDTMEILGGFEQVDYNCHLETLVLQTECILLDTVHILLFQPESNDQIIQLLMSWQTFESIGSKAYSNRSDELTTLSAETELFKERSSILSQIVDQLHSLNLASEKLAAIGDKLKTLRENVEKNGSLNCGGRFEWVDSVLIKCITEGRWLLVENVNLCTPAILDRLNGLLEPNGQLTLGEKGVDSNGALVTVKPHPNFRLFFTMDPQRGEISRAMRNRGLELFVESIDENLDRTILDIMAVLHSNGLRSHSTILSLLNVHFAVKNLNIGLDQISMSHLIHACFLLVQHARHKYPVDVSTRRSVFYDVYVKSRSLSYEQREMVAACVDSELKWPGCALADIPPFYLCADTKTMQRSVSGDRIQVESALSLLFVYLVAKNSHAASKLDELLFAKIPLSDAFRKQFDVGQLEPRNLLTYSVLNYYERASVSDATQRHVWLTRVVDYYAPPPLLLNTSSNVSYVKCVSVCLNELVTACAGAGVKNWPWDGRRLSNVRPRMPIDRRGSCDQLALKMSYALAQYRCYRLDCVQRLDAHDMDVNLSEYSLAHVSGNLPVSAAIEERLASNYNTVISRVDECCRMLLNLRDSSAYTEKYKLFIKLFNAYGRLASVGQIAFFSRSSRRANETLLNYLRLQMAWLYESMRNLIRNETNGNIIEFINSDEKEAILDVHNMLEGFFDSSFNALSSFVRKLKKKVGHTGDTEWKLSKNDDENFSNWIFRSPRSFDEYAELRNDLCKILAERVNLEKGDEKSTSETSNIADRPKPEKTSGADAETISPYEQYKYPVEMVPIFECFVLRLECLHKNAVQNRVARVDRAGKTDDRSRDMSVVVDGQLPSIIRSLAFVPVSYTYLLEKASAEDRFNMEWFIWTVNHARSFSTFSYKSYVKYREPVEQENAEESDESEGVLFCTYPVLVTFGNAFMFDLRKEKTNVVPELYKPSLKIYRNHQIMLNQFKEMLWGNSALLSDSFSCLKSSERESTLAHYRHLIVSMLTTLNQDVQSGWPISPLHIAQVTRKLREFVMSKQVADTYSKTVDRTITLLEVHLEDLHKMIAAMEVVDDDIGADDCVQWARMGKCWTLMGMVEFQLFSVLESVDPMLKKQFKNMNYDDDLEYVRCRLAVETMSAVLSGGGDHFPYRTMFENWRDEIERKRATTPAERAVRSRPEDYGGIQRSVQQFKSTVGSVDVVYSLCNRVFQRLQMSRKDVYSVDTVTETQSMVRECKAWIRSCDQFTNNLIADFAEYADVTLPVVYAVSTTSYGISMLSSCLHKWVTRCQGNQILSGYDSSGESTVETVSASLCTFPYFMDRATSNAAQLDRSDELISLLANDAAQLPDYSRLILRLTKSSLKELFAVLSVYENANRDARLDVWRRVDRLLDNVVRLWTEQEEKLEQRKLEEKNLYEFRAPKEEEEDRRRRNAFFAPTLDRDFETHMETVDDADDEEVGVEADPKKTEIYVTQEDMNEICSLHSELATNFTYTEWTRCSAVSGDSLRASLASSFCDRYSVFAAVLDRYAFAFDQMMDSLSLPALLVVANEASKMHTTVPKRISDFYHVADVEQVRLFYPLLVRIRNHAQALLKQWDDHPTLKGLLTIIDRIMSFEVTSPVSRFLTGADLLLKQLFEWEEIAHSGISFATLYEELTGLIFMWRKMEISHWKNSLEYLATKVKQNVSKWWFHLYSLCWPYKEDSQMAFADFVTVCQQYIESASLGEFESRLNLLYVFHCHYVNQPRTPRLREMCAALWNLYVYYRQFEDQVNNYLTSKSSEVRKKLSDFVKITRWNDINYWSVMKTVEKTHEQLMKYVKEYQAILETPVSCALTYVPSKGPLVEDLKTVAARLNTLYISEMTVPPANERYWKYGLKAKKFTKKIIKHADYRDLLEALNEAVESVNEDIDILNKNEIDRSVEKEKQKSQAKHLLQQKRKLVADLFRTLTRIGLSYRSGSVIARNMNFSVTFAHSQPLNVNQLFASLPTKRPADELLTSAWCGCENVFFNSIAKQSQLRLALQKPHQDLGPQMCDRVRGFAYHLLDININQKNNLVQLTNDLRDLRLYESILAELSASINFDFSENLHVLKNKFVETMFNSIYSLEQFLMLLDCCPENETTKLATPVVHVMSSEDASLLSVHKSSPLWTETRGVVEKHLRSLRTLKSRFLDDGGGISGTKIYDKFISANQYELMLSSRNDFGVMCDDLERVRVTFGSAVIGRDNVLCSTLRDVNEKVNELMGTIESFESVPTVAECDVEAVDVLKERVKKLTDTTLLAIQKLYKKDPEKKADEQQADRLKEGHLRTLLVKSLQENVDLLNMAEVGREARALVKLLMKNSSGLNRPLRITLLETFLPIFNQYCLLAEYMVTEFVTAFKITSNLSSSVFSLFVELTVNGFRIPPELLEEEKEGEGSKEKGGMGLEDGEGAKDVSDQIESEDQLEGARRPEDQNEEEDKECKEEENGVEMSEDFGGKSQNLEQKEGDENDDDGEGEDELEKEMGETGEEAETLDQKVWNTDSENEEDSDADEGKEEGHGQGEEMGEKEMGAKDERTKNYDEEVNDKESSKEDKQKEINEMDDQQPDDDQIDPYHGKQDPLPEPEALDLPDDLQLDEGEAKEDGGEEENPFDIDAMKELMPPKEEETAQDEDGQEQKETNDEESTENEPDEADDEVGTKRDEETLEEDPADESPSKTDEGMDDGGKKDEDKIGDEQKPEDDKNAEEAQPSEDKPCETAAESTSAEKGSKDLVNQRCEEKIEEEGEKYEKDTAGIEQQGVGEADQPQDDTAEGHSSAKSEGAQSRDHGSREQKRKLRPGESDANRTLADSKEPFKKRLKTVEASEQEDDEAEGADFEAEEEEDESSLYQHVKEAEKGTAETVDAATKEQAEKQPVVDEDPTGEQATEDDKMDLEDMDDEEKDEDVSYQKSDKMKQSKRDKTKPDKDGDESADEELPSGETKIEGEFVETMTVERGLESTFHTLAEEQIDEDQSQLLTLEYIESLKNKVQDQLSTWSQTPALEDASVAWEMFSAITSNLSQELCEQLRLVLEPTQASRLKGDFRTGRRINMRKVIPYIASQFRKDKIWLRRTKPSKREYQIILAIDNSSSMSDNHSKELAFESVALVSKALSLIEAGELGVISFGESTKVVHPLGEPFTSQTGAKLVRDFTFDENRTKYAEAVHIANGIFLTRGNKAVHAAKSAQLLVIVSDGRNVAGEGASVIRSAVRAAKQAGIFIVFLIVENPECKTSILDVMSVSSIIDNKPVIQSYIESFPFPFYIILRDINQLPAVLAEALQQWFELVTNISD